MLGRAGSGRDSLFCGNGGSYLGICGGAGLATENGLSLCPFKGRALRKGFPVSADLSACSLLIISFGKHSNTCLLRLVAFQLRIAAENEIRLLAVYEEAQAEAMSADIKVGEGQNRGWSELEERYGILLDPTSER